MDGNGRWAKERMLPRVEGHRAGAKTVRMVVEESRRLGIRFLTLFAFSSENWGRPEAEVNTLMGLFAAHLESELPLLLQHGIKLTAIGDRTRLPPNVTEPLRRTEAQTAHQSGMEVLLAVSYGSRDEITSAAQKIGRLVASGNLNPDDITSEHITQNLYAPHVPDPDLLIRTSNELRLSNFLLWQLAYSEIVVSPLRWPEFSKDEYFRCLQEYSNRDRRYGLTQEQVAAGVASAK